MLKDKNSSLALVVGLLVGIVLGWGGSSLLDKECGKPAHFGVAPHSQKNAKQFKQHQRSSRPEFQRKERGERKGAGARQRTTKK